MILMGVLSLALSAVAQGQFGPDRGSTDYKSRAELVATELGMRFDASGLAEKAVENGVETFAVRVVADSRDGTLFEVTIVSEDGKDDVGAVKMVLGSGLLVLRSSIDPSAAFPVSRIKAVVVTYKGETILEGRFADRELDG